MALETIFPTVTPETVRMKGYNERKPQRYFAGRRESTSPVLIILRNPHAVPCTIDHSCNIIIDYKESEGREQLEDIASVYGDIFDTSTKIPLMGIELLEEKYVIKNKVEVATFLDEHTNFIGVLVETCEQIKKIFDKNIVEISLSLNEDPEEDFIGLSIVVRTPLKSEVSLDLLDKFDDEWWLDLDAEIRNAVTVIVRSV